jgi:cell division protein FtsQ
MAEQRITSEPRGGVRGSLGRMNKPGWKVLGGLGVALLLWFGGPFLGRQLDFFRVRRIEFVGMRHLERGRAVAALALGPAASVFDDRKILERRLVAIRGVRSATVGRRLPGTLVVELDEWDPVALAPDAGKLAFMDETGRMLPFDPTESAAAADLPVAPVPDRVIGRVLANVRAQEPALFAEIATAVRSGGDVLLVARDRRIWFGPDVSAEEVRAVMAVAHDLARRGQTYSELDGRYAGQVIVRGIAAARTASSNGAAPAGARA